MVMRNNPRTTMSLQDTIQAAHRRKALLLLLEGSLNEYVALLLLKTKGRDIVTKALPH
jgi:hypothetical protein